ncbi:hypothetical protein H0266_04835 [Halobacillus locisalis]|uniref:Uncharacterized protein n=1 Tax=Halobacillus locisalis TaxID=220753 RepID=A0A838CR45_9BACI|nr:hypothetical protein [Halobacillus locisalis]MBA2174225.1 hypothetical protein [Halobacillus locisalis]
MNKTKIQSLILLAVTISAITMGVYAFNNYSNGNTEAGVTFTVLTLFFIALASFGVVRNKRVNN